MAPLQRSVGRQRRLIAACALVGLKRAAPPHQRRQRSAPAALARRQGQSRQWRLRLRRGAGTRGTEATAAHNAATKAAAFKSGATRHGGRCVKQRREAAAAAVALERGGGGGDGVGATRCKPRTHAGCRQQKGGDVEARGRELRGGGGCGKRRFKRTRSFSVDVC